MSDILISRPGWHWRTCPSTQQLKGSGGCAPAKRSVCPKRSPAGNFPKNEMRKRFDTYKGRRMSVLLQKQKVIFYWRFHADMVNHMWPLDSGTGSTPTSDSSVLVNFSGFRAGIRKMIPLRDNRWIELKVERWTLNERWTAWLDPD